MQLIWIFEHNAPHNHNHGGTIFHDAINRLIWAEHQSSLGAGENLIVNE